VERMTASPANGARASIMSAFASALRQARPARSRRISSMRMSAAADRAFSDTA